MKASARSLAIQWFQSRARVSRARQRRGRDAPAGGMGGLSRIVPATSRMTFRIDFVELVRKVSGSYAGSRETFRH
jgi:hypothetical protein